jgi:hypothetical protein
MRKSLSLALLLLALLTPSAARAGEPPTLGGTLGATRTEIIVDSSASVPVMVSLSVPEGWRLAEGAFAMEPGGHRVVAVLAAGEEGQVIARMVAFDVPAGTDRSTLLLSLGLPKPEPVWPQLLAAAFLLMVAVVTITIVARRRQTTSRARQAALRRI